MSGGSKRSKRLNRVADLARNGERAAARRLADARRLVDEQRGQLEEFKRYRDDYIARLDAAGPAAAGGIARIRNYRVFLARLAAAIDEQARRLHQTEQQYWLRRDEWLAERARAQALAKVVERHRADEARAADRRENREQDERAQHVRSRWNED